MPEAFFWLFSVTAVVSALCVILNRQAVGSAFSMFGFILSVSGLMASLGAYMLSLITLLVYAGAILVLFVFVIMFVGQRVPRKQVGRWRCLAALLAVVGLAIYSAPLYALSVQPQIFGNWNSLPNNVQYGLSLFGQYQLATQFTGWVLLWVTVGVYKLATSKEDLTA